MKPHTTGRKPARDGSDAIRWSRVADVETSADRDIETVVRVLQKKHGYTREVASAELLRMLSIAA